MLAAGSLAFAKAYSSVEKLEIELEAEIQRDKENDAADGKTIQVWRRRGGKFLLSKYILLFIVVLNIIDCTLVLGELILDLHHVKDILFDSQQSSETFIKNLQIQYPDRFSDVTESEIEIVYDRILQAEIQWPRNESNSYMLDKPNGKHRVVINDSENSGNYSSNTTENFLNISTVIPPYIYTLEADSEDDEVLKTLGFVFHKISLTISVILVLWVCLKILCFGRDLLHRKLEVFDTFVILTSFIVDMIFVKGFSMYTLRQFIYILAFMLPWRVIRVTNSLVVAVKDHEHFRLKLLFTQKKKTEHENKQIRAERDSYKEQVEALKKLCLSEGVDDWKIFQSLARPRTRPGGKGAMGSFASLAFGALGNKSSSFWSVLSTPKMRRGKSMDVLNKNSPSEPVAVPHTKHNAKKRIFGFLGTSADYIRGKIKDDHHLSIDSDPGISSNYLRNNINGPMGKRLTRGETIDDTMSIDSVEDNHINLGVIEDFAKQDTLDSSVNDDSGSGTPVDWIAMQRTHSDCLASREPIETGVRLTSSAGAMDTLTVDYAPNDRVVPAEISEINGKHKKKK